jgi:phage terminase large subunit-like protein
MANAWLSYNDYQNDSTFSLEQLRGWYYISGNDFAETTDLCSNDMMFMDPATLDVYFHSHYWICESKADDKDNTINAENKDYRLWAKEGYCTILKGNNVDVSVIADYHYELYKKFGIKPFKIGYDNRFIKDFQKKIVEYFGDDLLENIPQKPFALSNPMRTLEADLKDKKVNYNNNPISRWCFSNTAFKTDNLGFIIPCKMSRENRIDGTASKIICYATLEKFKSEFLEIIRMR